MRYSPGEVHRVHQRAAERRRAATWMVAPVAILLVSFSFALLISHDASGPGSCPVGSFAGPGLEGLVSMFVRQTLPPTALLVFIVAGLLRPPRPFRTGALLGLLDGILWSLLLVTVPSGASNGTPPLADLAAILILGAVLGTVVTGTVGTVAGAIGSGWRHVVEDVAAD